MKRVLVALFTSALAACATSPTERAEATAIPANRLLAFQKPIVGRQAVLLVTRDSGFMGGGCYKSLWINGTLAARVDVSETARFFVEPGEVLIKVGRDPLGSGLCATGQDQYTQRETTLKVGESKSFRMSSDSNNLVDIQRAD